MNARVVIAQAGGGSNGTTPTQIIHVVKPAAGQTQTFTASADGTVKVDFSAIADEKITLYRDSVDHSLHIIFADGSQAIILSFFDDSNNILSNIFVEIGPNLDFNNTQFAAQFPITTDQSVLPAAGGSTPASGADFHTPTVDPLTSFTPLGLLGSQTTEGALFSAVEPNVIGTIPQLIQVTGTVSGIVEEEQLGHSDNGDNPDGPIAFVSLESLSSIGNEDTNDASTPPGGTTSDGLDRDTPTDYNITTDEFHGTGTTSLTTLVSGGEGTLTFYINSAIAGATVVDGDGHPVTSGGATLHYGAVETSGTDTTVFAGTGSGEGFQPVFELTIHANGDYDFVLLHQIDHPDHTVDIGNTAMGAQEEALYLDLTSLVGVHDQSPTPQVLSLTGSDVFTIGVLDDTPMIYSSSADSQVAVVQDETPGVQNTANDTTDQSVVDLFHDVQDKGHDPDVANSDQIDGAIGYAQSETSLFYVSPEFGADGPKDSDHNGIADADAAVFSLALNGTSGEVDSGLQTTDHHEIFLFQEGDLIVGRYQAGGQETLEVQTEGQDTSDLAAFAIAIDPVTGQVSVAQYVSLYHPNAQDSNDVVGIAGNSINGVYTVTDGDGDKDILSQDISTQIRFADDGPTIDPNQASSLRDWTLDEDVLPAAGHDSPIGNDAYDTTPDTNDYTSITDKPLGVDWGADGPQSLTFAETDGQPSITITDSNGSPLGPLTSGGVELVYHLETTADGGETLTATKGEGGDTVFTLSLDPTADPSGAFSFQLDGALDHPAGGGENTLNLRFDFNATDGDGDTASSFITVRITDDVPVAQVGDLETVSEADLSDGTTPDVSALSATGHLHIAWGADDNNPTPGSGSYDRSVTFTDANVTVMSGDETLSQLTSNGQAVHYTIANGELIGYTGSSHHPHVVFTVSLSDSNDGSYTFTLNDTLDDPKTSDALTLTFNYTATDSDGDPSSSTFSVTVDDDHPIAGVGDAETVKEANLLTGTSPDLWDLTAAGSLNITWGADNHNNSLFSFTSADRSVSFTDTTVHATDGSGNDLGGLTSDGHALNYALVGNVLYAYTTSVLHPVFLVTLNDSGNGGYTFTLLSNLDHPTGDGNNTLNLTFDYTATDADGDSSSSTFTVSVVDDVPVAGVGDLETVSESALSDGTSPDLSGTSATGHLHIAWGADDNNPTSGSGSDDRSVAFTDANVTVTSGDETLSQLTSNGQTVHYMISNGDLIGYTGSSHHPHDVFTVSLSDSHDGTYTFTLQDTLDDPKTSDALTLTFNYTATDSDGDTSNSSTFSVTVDDDHPIAGVGDTETVNEANLLTGTSPDIWDLTTAGSLNIQWGADNHNNSLFSFTSADRSVSFTDTTVHATDGSGNDLGGLTSDGNALNYALVGNVLYAYTTSVLHPVFLVTLNDGGNGGYTFTLLGNLDHPVHSTTPDTLNLTFDYTATDADGDSSSSTFTVSVVDDVPTVGHPVTGSTQEIGVVSEFFNGSFEADSLASGTPGVITDARGNYTYDAPAGWTITGGDGGLFAPTSAISDSSEHSGSNVVWLRDGATLAQTTHTSLVAGDIYTVHFDLGDRTDQAFPGGTVTLLAVNGSDSVQLAQASLPTPGDGEWTGVDLSTGQIANNLAGYDLRIEIQQGDGTGNQILIDNVGLDTFTPVTDTHSLDVHWGADNDPALRSVAFDVASGATGLTSNGEAIHYELASSTLLNAISADGRTVFTVALSSGGSGSYTFTLLDNLDHLGANNTDLPLNFAFTATDSDGDTTPGSFEVDVHDAAPVSTGDVVAPVTLYDEAQTGGNIGDGSGGTGGDGGHSDPGGTGGDGTGGTGGQGDIFGEGGAGGDGAGGTGGSGDPGGTGGDGTGGTGGHGDVFGDGGTGGDGAGGTGGQGDPGGAGDPPPDLTSVSGDAGALFTVGADNVKSIALNAPEFEAIYVDGNGLAHQESVSIGLTATAPDGSTTWTFSSDHIADVATLTINADGSYSFALFAPLVHPTPGPAEETMPLKFGYTVTDGDNDTASGSLTVDVLDDVPVAGTGDTGSVAEHDLSGHASFAQDFDHATDAASAGFSDGGDYGNLTIQASGTDGIDTKSGTGDYALVTQTDSGPFTRFGGYDTSFDGGFTASVDIYLDAGKIADGQGFDYSVAADRQDGTFLRDFIFHVANVGGQLLVGASNNTNFDPDLNLPNENHGTVGTAGWYTFQEVFHDAGDGSLAVDMVVRDASGAVVFTQTLNDPADTLANIVGGNRYGWFTNVDVPGGIAIDNVSLTKADSFTATSFTGSLHESAGADGLGSLTFSGVTDGAAVYDSSNTALKAGGESVYYHVIDTHTLEGVAQDGHVVFSVALDPTSGNYTFTLESPVDHPAAETNSLSLDFGYTVTDGDGDPASNGFSVSIADDVPTAPTIDVTTVSPSGTATLIHDETAGVQQPTPSDPVNDVATLPAVFVGDSALPDSATAVGFASRAGAVVVDPHYGADGPGSTLLTLTDSAGQAFAGLATNFFDTATGDRIYLYTDAAGNVVGRLGDGSGTQHPDANGLVAFAVGVGQDGTLSFAEYRALQDNPATVNDPNDLVTLQIAGGGGNAVYVTAVSTDFDGDTSSATTAPLVIRVQDDGPTATSGSENLLVNGDFTAGFATQQSYGGSETTDSGWLIQASPDGGASHVQLERIPSGYFGMTTPNGAPMVDLEASPGNVEISQAVLNLTAGQSYTIEFMAGSPNSSSELQVYWGGTLLADFHPGSTMTTYTYTVTAGANDAANTLTFTEVGASGDNTGTYLANVAVFAADDSGPGSESVLTSAPGAHLDLVEHVVLSSGTDGWFGGNFNQAAVFTATPTVQVIDPISGQLETVTWSQDHSASGQVTLVGTVGTGFNTTTVLTVTLNADGTVNYQQNVALYHDHSSVATDSSETLAFSYTVTDGDGDTTAPQTVSFVVQDDLPTVTGPVAVQTVSESGLPLVQSTFEFLDISWGADSKDAHLSFALDGNGHPIAPAGVTAGGEPLVYVLGTQNGEQELIAYKQGDPQDSAHEIFSVVLNSPVNPTAIFTLYQALDETSGNGDGNTLPLTFKVNATDGDGDTVQQTFTFDVQDDVPTLTPETVHSALDEDARIDQSAVSVSAGLGIHWGADGAGTLAMTTTVDVTGLPSGENLQSNGQDVLFTTINGALVGYVGDSSNPPTATDASNVVFSVALDPSGNGSYTFTLDRPLDHLGNAGDPITLGFHAAGTDGDGDPVSPVFHVDISPAGQPTSADYSALHTGVFVNLDSQDHTYDGQTVAAHTATDMTGQGPIVGVDSVSGLDATGGDGNDVLVGPSSSSATILGTLDGGAGDDLLVVEPNQVVAGGTAPRVFDHGDGTSELVDISGLAGEGDKLIGGSGTDTVQFDLDGTGAPGFVFDRTGSNEGTLSGIEHFVGTDGNDVIMLPAGYTTDGGPVTIDGGKGDDIISGTNSADIINGGDGNDKIAGLGGDDTIHGDAGNDEIWAGSGNDTVYGDSGDDTIHYALGSGTDIVDGGDGNDTLDVTSIGAAPVIEYVRASGTDVLVTPTQFNAQPAPAPYGDTLTVRNVETLNFDLRDGNWLVFGQGGSDLGAAGVTNVNVTGDDTGTALWFSNVSSPTVLNATLGGGDDTYMGGGQAVNQTVDGGDGTDTVDFSQVSEKFDINLASGVTERMTYGGTHIATDSLTNFENATGSLGDDVIRGTDGANILNGGGGNDLIIGGSDIVDNGGFRGPAEAVLPIGSTTAVDLGGGWDVTNGTVDLLFNGGSLGENFPAGINVVDMRGVSNGTISQTLATVAGQTYTVTFLESVNPDLLTHTPDGSASVTVSVDGGSAQTFTATVPHGTTWGDVGQTFVEQTYTFTATSDSTTLSFASVPGNGDQYYGALIGEVSVSQNGADTAGDTLSGGDGNDVIHGSGGNDAIDGGTGNDLIFGGAGDDVIQGGDGNDTIAGDAGNDTIHGGAGDDTILYGVGGGNDIVDGGTGTDTLVVTGDAEARTFTVGEGSLADADNVVPQSGTDHADLLVSYTGTDAATVRADEVEDLVVHAGSAGDTLAIGDVADTGLAPTTVVFDGGAGNDVLDLTGFSGNTRVVFNDPDPVTSGDTDLVELSGKWADYTVTDNGDGSYTIAGDGVLLTTSNVETFSFAADHDGEVITLAQLIEQAPDAIDVSGAVTEAGGVANGTAGIPTYDGNVSFTDGNPLDIVTVTAVGAGTSPAATSTVAGSSATVVNGVYGSLSIHADGTYTYTLDNDSSATQALDAGQQVHDVFTYTVTDAKDEASSAQIDILVTGSDDAPVITIPNGESVSTSIPGLTGDDVVTRSLGETGSHLTASGTLAVSDVDAGDTVTAVVKSVSGGGSGYDAHDALGFLTVSPSPVIDGSHASPETLTWSFDTGSQNFDFLPDGWQVRLNYTVEVTDSQGETSDQVISVLITGTNDAPVIEGTSVVSGTVVEAGDLPFVGEAGLGGPLHIDSAVASASSTALGTLDGQLPGFSGNTATGQADIAAAVSSIESAAGVDEGTAIAVVWQHLDAMYVSAGANQVNVNAAFLYLGLEYAAYVKAGGSPLVDVVAKYTADGPDADTVPDRDQSLHDNLLGNLTDYALQQRYGAGSALYDQMHALVVAQDASLLTRTVQAVGGYENDPAGSTAADGHAYDLSHGYAEHVSGQLVAHDPDAGDDAHLTWSIANGTGTYGSIAIDATTGVWTYTLDDSKPATEALGAGETATETFTATVSDGHGGTAQQTVTITVDGTNDAPVLNTPAAESSATLYAGGGLDDVVTADVAPDHKFYFEEPAGSPDRLDPALDTQIGTLLTANPTDMQAVLTGVEGALGHAAGMADAIAAVWTYIDSHYSYYDNAINADGVRLAIAYAQYVQGGGEPLTGVIVKYTPDGNADGIPDRSQSMHDNILGNLDYASMVDKFLGAGQGSNPNPDQALFNELEAEISAAGLTNRPIYSGNEGVDPSPARGWDLTYSVLPGGTHQAVSGYLTATDVDTNDAGHLTWSIDQTSPYGTMAIDSATGEWTFTLDNSKPATVALGGNDVVTETFVATVTDGHGGSASQNVTITIHGINDVPLVGGGNEGSVVEAGDLPDVGEAGLGGPLHIDSAVASASSTALGTLDGQLPGFSTDTATGQADIAAVVSSIESAAGVDEGTAIAVVWQHLDAMYVSAGANQVNVNAAFLYLGLEYAAYVQGGGSPLVDVVAKYAADGNNDGVADRDQSLHDNLLGNLTDYALQQRYVNGSALYDQMHALVAAQDATLLARTGQAVGGYENDPAGSTAADGHAYDLSHGYAEHVSGQLVAFDPDTGDTMTWSIANGTGTYGSIAIDATTGVWTYTLDDSLAATQALQAGQTATEEFIATVSDGHGGIVHEAITITVDGTNDAPTLSGDLKATVTEGGTYTLTTADLAATDPDNTATDLVYTVTGEAHGTVLVDNAIATSFTAQDVIDGHVVFQHDGSEGPQASLSVSLSDGGTDMPVAATVNFNVSPVDDGNATLDIVGASSPSPVVGDVLQAVLGTDPDGTETNVVYHWERDGHDTGATGDTYTLTSNDLGHQIDVTATYTDGQNFNDTSHSADTGVVVDSNHAPVAVDDALANDALPPPSVTGAVQFNENGHYYLFVDTSTSWSNAESIAESLGGYLATDTSSAENEFLGEHIYISGGGAYWLGGSDAQTEGQWTWVTGPESGTQFWSGGSGGNAVGGSFEAWGAGEPNNFFSEDYLTLNNWYGYNYWNDASSAAGYIVEWGGGPNSFVEDTTIVIQASKLLANDSDPDGDTFTIHSVEGALHGTVQLSPDHQTITFTPDQNYNGEASFTYDVVDSHGAISNEATVSFDIAAVNDAPVNSVPGAQTASRSAPLVFSQGNGNKISVSDVDADGGTEQVTLSVGHGALTLGSTAGLTFQAGNGIADGSMAFTGTLLAIDAALDGLSYQADGHFAGSDTLYVTTDDLGHTGSGGALTTTDTVAINVVDQAPTDIVFTGNDDLSVQTVQSGHVTQVNNGSTLFAASAVDPDDTSGFHYSFNGNTSQAVTVGGNSETFTINAGTGYVTTTKLDYTSVQNISLTLETTDSHGASHSEALNLWLGLDNAGDTIDGSAIANDQIIYGFGGNDTLIGGSGNDSIYGGDGDDIIVAATNDVFVDGGSNSDNNLLDPGNRGDVLVLSGDADLTSVGNIFHNFETISMRNSDGSTGNSTLTLSIEDVFDIAGTGTANPAGGSWSSEPALRIDGDSNDTLNLQSDTGSWIHASGIAPSGYDAYVHVASGSIANQHEDAYLFVATGLTVHNLS